ncbi:putative colanic acid biosynthesis acetyltransferase WcaB [Pedobacter sp. UYP30]|uniref:serine acetyltransferase n=1 Tax=Pedobacter sp. UYP30 TaxID=1756400 RepID=UPI00339AC82D
MGVINYIFQDKQANIANPTKGKYVVVLFRISQLIVKRKITKILFFWYLLFYRVVVEYFMCVELSWHTAIGPNFAIWHGTGLVIHPETTIGSNCNIRQCTTVGVKQIGNGLYGNAPKIGNFVDIGCNTVIIGDLVIGDYVAIGAGSVVVKPIESNAVVAGNPAKFIRLLNH